MPKTLLRRCALTALLAAALAPAAPAPKIYGQELVDRTLLQHPELESAVIIAVPPAAAAAVVVASNIGQIGKAASPADQSIAAGGKPEAKLLPGGARVVVELPLLNVVGEPVGALTLEWDAHAGSTAALTQQAETLRDALARRILNTANLFDPFPLDPAVVIANRAQKLVDQAQAAHPEVEVLALRSKVGATQELVLLGSTFGRQGKKADGDDLKVLNSSAAATGIYSNGKRFGVDLALHDRAGAIIGTMNVGYAYRAGDDTQPLLDQALRLRDELQRQIPPGQALDQADP
jgi:iron complex outermembrane receptor protein